MGKKRKSDDELKYKYRALKIDGVRIDLHHHIMEQILGRKLAKDEVVHHIDGNKLNNDPSNLQVMTRAEHSRIHMLGSHNTEEAKAKISKSVSKAWESGAFDSIKKPVEAYDKKTGEFVARYDSIGDAERAGYFGTKVSACCKGKIPSYKGFVWKYATVNTDKPA